MSRDPIDVSKLGYRPCVGIMVLNRQGLVWVGRRADAPGDAEGRGNWWQMPQGGIDKGEDPAAAALRELKEETGLTNVTMLGETPGWLRYDLPPTSSARPGRANTAARSRNGSRCAFWAPIRRSTSRPRTPSRSSSWNGGGWPWASWTS